MIKWINCLTVEDTMTCIEAMLHTEQLVGVSVKVSIKYHRELSTARLIHMYESSACYEGLLGLECFLFNQLLP